MWMGFAFAADVIAEGLRRGTRNGVGMVGRDEPNGRGKCRVIRLSLLSMKGLYNALGSERVGKKGVLREAEDEG